MQSGLEQDSSVLESQIHADEQGLASGLFIAAFQIGSGVILGIDAAVFAANVDFGLGVARHRPA